MNEHLGTETPCHSQKRARSGGEYGPNGEWYNGGAFIATKDLPKRMREWVKKTSVTELVTVELSTRTSPGIRVAPRLDEFPIACIVTNVLVSGEINVAHLNYWRGQGEHEYADTLLELANKYLAGERWLRLSDYPRLARMDDILRLILAGKFVPEESFAVMSPTVRSRLQELARYMAGKCQ